MYLGCNLELGVDESSLTLAANLPLSPECWNYRHVPPHLASKCVLQAYIKEQTNWCSVWMETLGEIVCLPFPSPGVCLLYG